MKLVAEHLGEIILAVAGVALVVGVILACGDSIESFFEGIFGKYEDLGFGEDSPLWEVTTPTV